MITTIIITILASVFSTLVCGYFLWLYIGVRELKKKVKDNTDEISFNGDRISSIDNDYNTRISDLSRELNDGLLDSNKLTLDKENEIYNQMNKKIDNTYVDMDKRFNNSYQAMKSLEAELLRLTSKKDSKK